MEQITMYFEPNNGVYKKIAAIKYLRAATGFELVHAKNLVDWASQIGETIFDVPDGTATGVRQSFSHQIKQHGPVGYVLDTKAVTWEEIQTAKEQTEEWLKEQNLINIEMDGTCYIDRLDVSPGKTGYQLRLKPTAEWKQPYIGFALTSKVIGAMKEMGKEIEIARSDVTKNTQFRFKIELSIEEIVEDTTEEIIDETEVH